jgi:hypothetical protein
LASCLVQCSKVLKYNDFFDMLASLRWWLSHVTATVSQSQDSINPEQLLSEISAKYWDCHAFKPGQPINTAQGLQTNETQDHQNPWEFS